MIKTVDFWSNESHALPFYVIMTNLIVHVQSVWRVVSPQDNIIPRVEIAVFIKWIFFPIQVEICCFQSISELKQQSNEGCDYNKHPYKKHVEQRDQWFLAYYCPSKFFIYSIFIFCRFICVSLTKVFIVIPAQFCMYFIQIWWIIVK